MDHGSTNEQKAARFLKWQVGEALSKLSLQQRVAMAVSSLPALGFGICAPFGASSST
jgi:hypothetical protein